MQKIPSFQLCFCSACGASIRFLTRYDKTRKGKQAGWPWESFSDKKLKSPVGWLARRGASWGARPRQGACTGGVGGLGGAGHPTWVCVTSGRKRPQSIKASSSSRIGGLTPWLLWDNGIGPRTLMAPTGPRMPPPTDVACHH